MSGQQEGVSKPEKNKLKLGKPFVNTQADTNTIKPKTQLKKKSEPFGQNREQMEKEKQVEADNYWNVDIMPNIQYINSATMANNNYFNMPVHQNLHNLHKTETLMDQITFDEEEFISNPEKYLEQLPDECLDRFEDYYNTNQIDQIIDDLDEGKPKEDTFEERMKSCTCCRGFIYKCKGKMCYNLGVCQCQVRTEMEAVAEEHFIPECKDCACCRGYVYTCMGVQCHQNKKGCICFESE